MMYFLAKELIDLPGMRCSLRAVQIHLKQIAADECKRKRAKTNAFEYHIDCLPEETRMFLLQRQAKEIAEEIALNAKPEEERKSSEEAWYEYEESTTQVKEQAVKRLEAALLVKALMEKGDSKTKAIEKAGELTDFTPRAIKKWFYVKPRLNRIESDDWLPFLAMRQGLKNGDGRKAEFSSEAQRFFKTAYLRADVTVAEAHRLTVKASLKHGWKVPEVSVLRKWVDQNIPHELRVLLKKGKAAAQQSLVLTQRRTRMGMHALELVNGDGHVARVHCQLESGKVFRPMVWVFQDVFSSAIVGYSIDLSENNEMLSIAVANTIKKYGLPGGWLFDRGSAALSDNVTGSMVKPNKKGKYKKFSSSELEGLLQMLGYTSNDINWTGIVADDVGNKGNARGKPVERLFHNTGGIGQFERHPAFEGCYTGKDVMSRPSNYEGGSRGVPFELFCELFDGWVVDHNNYVGRRTEMARGVKSYQQVFDESYAVAQIKKPTQEQIRLCLLRQEAVMVRESGSFELKASRYKAKTDSHYLTNRYQSPRLYDYIGEKVGVRFNPYDMHSEVYAYDKNGRFLCVAEMVEDSGFKSLSAKRIQALQQTDMAQRLDVLQQQADLMDKAHFVESVKSLKTDESELGSVVPGIIEMTPALPTNLDGYKKIATQQSDDLEDDDESIINALFNTFQNTSNG